MTPDEFARERGVFGEMVDDQVSSGVRHAGVIDVVRGELSGEPFEKSFELPERPEHLGVPS